MGPCRYNINFIKGQDKNTCITKIFCKDAHGCVIVSDITNKQTLTEYNKFLIFIRTVKWKNSIDETARFVDNGLLPAILIENKIDLVSDEQVKNETELKEFSERNKFSQCFRASAKMGVNINESMEYLIKTIISRMDEYSKDGQIPLEKDRRSIVLTHNKYISSDEKPKSNCC
jgi:GTPase SAR1 family protein